MDITLLTQRPMTPAGLRNERFHFAAAGGIQVYPNSINRVGDALLFVGSTLDGKFLWAAAPTPDDPMLRRFLGERVTGSPGPDVGVLLRCPMNHDNAGVIRATLPFTRAVPLGLRNSFGLGDRLGLANPAHLRAISGTGFSPVLAQQSVRELERTRRETEDVMDAATWAVLQEGFKEEYGADADHLKTPEDIDRYARAGFTMYTLDVGAHVVNEALRLPLEDVRARLSGLPWDVLDDLPRSLVERYAGRVIEFAPGDVLNPTEGEVVRAAVKYGAGIAQAVRLCRHLKERWPGLKHEIELSVDETDSPTSPLEHVVIAGELRRLGVSIVSLAPRFVGDFEKGIEYKGDLEAFRQEFVRHAAIARLFGPYKISIHSGSDKFDIYRLIGSLGDVAVHVKTAGTSWLEALRTIALVEPRLFREILDHSRVCYEKDRASYHVTATVERLRPTEQYASGDLPSLLDDDNARQILHVTFGSILSAVDEQGGSRFKARILDSLRQSEETHYQVVARHISRHLEPLSAHSRPAGTVRTDPEQT